MNVFGTVYKAEKGGTSTAAPLWAWAKRSWCHQNPAEAAKWSQTWT